jgi:DNA-binding SARP family transcriptional activator
MQSPTLPTPQLTVHLFGPGVLTADGAVARPHSARTLALLAYLVVEAGRRHPRAALADLLWPDLPEASGRQSLRQALYSLKSVADGRLNECLQVDSKWVLFTPPAPASCIDVDVCRFLAAVRGDAEADWRQAAAIQRAPLLDGPAAVPGSEYEAWLHGTRDRLRALAMQNLDRLVIGHMARGEWDGAAEHAIAMGEFDATSEIASQHRLRIFAAQGRMHAVDAEWERLCARLSQVLGVEPGADSMALYRSLRQPGAQPPSTDLAAEATRPTVTPGAIREAEAMLWAGQAAERVFAFSQAADLYERALRVLSREAAAPARRIDAMLRLEAVLEKLGRRADQAELIDETMVIAQDLGDPARLAIVCLRRASVCAYQQRHGEARAAAERARQIFQGLGDVPGEAEALRELGFMHWHADQHADALQRTREALDLHRRIGDATGEATALHNLAEIHRSLGSPAMACLWFEQAMHLHWAARNPAGEILSLFGWAGALRQAGDLATSTDKLHAALKLSDLSGERVMTSRVLHALSMHNADQGALDVAVDFMRRAIEVDRTIGYAHALGHDLIDLSNLHLLKGEVAQARVAMLEAMVWFGFNEDDEARDLTCARLADLDANRALPMPANQGRGGVKSHLTLGEGKVYCEFESPMRSARPGLA